MTATTVTLMQHADQAAPGLERASFSGRAAGAPEASSSGSLYTDVPVVVHANEQKALKSEVREAWCIAAEACAGCSRKGGFLSRRPPHVHAPKFFFGHRAQRRSSSPSSPPKTLQLRAAHGAVCCDELPVCMTTPGAAPSAPGH